MFLIKTFELSKFENVVLGEDKIDKLINILTELLYETDNSEDYTNITNHFLNCFDYALTHDNFAVIVKTLSSLREIVNDSSSKESLKKNAKKTIYIAGSSRIVSHIGTLLDKGQIPDRNEFNRFIETLDTNAAASLIRLLGSLETIRARKYIIETLVSIGNRDISLVLSGLKDSKWYVARNIIYILRKINNTSALEPLTQMIKHPDIRVKKEAFKAIGSLGRAKAAFILTDSLEDADIEVRKAALHAMKDIGSESAKRTIMDHISKKQFIDTALEEKKFFYSTLAKWKDPEVYRFLTDTMSRKKLWKKTRNDESRACAAYCLGLLGDGNAVQLLQKYKASGNKKLSDISSESIRSIERVHQKRSRDQ